MHFLNLAWCPHLCAQVKLSKEEQQRLLEEKLAKIRADKAKKEKELEKQQELGRIQMNKELNEVSSCFCPIHVSSRNLQIWRERGRVWSDMFP